MTATNQQDSQEPTCLCQDSVFFNEPCPAHPKPDSQAGDVLDIILLQYLSMARDLHPSRFLGIKKEAKATLEDYAERLATKRAVELADSVIGEDEEIPDNLDSEGIRFYRTKNGLRAEQRQRLATLTEETKS